MLPSMQVWSPDRRRSARRTAGLMTLALTACASPKASQTNPSPSLLADRAADAGLIAVHVAGRAGAYRMQEIMGSGAALFDADGDGDLDLFLPQGNFDPPRPDIVDRLFRNDLPQPGAMPRFVDVTESAGVASAGYSVGAAAADYDDDGAIDLFVAAVGADRLLRNRGNGTFEDVTTEAGLAQHNDWSIGGVWLDFDRDGDLDLFVIRYLDLPPGPPVVCPTASGEKDYCGPTTYEPLTDLLYRNIGGGRFEDASSLLGGGRRPGSGLGAVSLDVDGDGWLDLAVANDKMANFLWINHNGQRFTEEAVERGTAVNEDGVAEAGMGIAAADHDGDGDEDLAIAHLAGETHTLYRNDGGWFTDATRRSGLGTTSLAATGFGLAWLDLDRDSHLDLLSINGHVHRLPDLAERGDPFPYHQPSQLWLGRANGQLEEASSRAAAALGRSAAARGLAVGDLDNDGDADLVVTAIDAPAALWLASAPPANQWVGLRLITGSRDALGAEVEVESGDLRLKARVGTDGSYASSRDPRLLFGLGQRSPSGMVHATVRWISGRTERFDSLPAGRYHTLTEGTGGAVGGGGESR